MLIILLLVYAIFINWLFFDKLMYDTPSYFSLLLTLCCGIIGFLGVLYWVSLLGELNSTKKLYEDFWFYENQEAILMQENESTVRDIQLADVKSNLYKIKTEICKNPIYMPEFERKAFLVSFKIGYNDFIDECYSYKNSYTWDISNSIYVIEQ